MIDLFFDVMVLSGTLRQPYSFTATFAVPVTSPDGSPDSPTLQVLYLPVSLIS